MKLIPAHTHNKVRIFSFGGGVQSTAVLVLTAQGRLRYDYFVFANVGDDSENPGTLQYIEEVAKPYAKKHGIEIVTVQKTTFGKPETLYQYIMRQERSIPIPAWMQGTKQKQVSQGRRTCTANFKVKVVDKWIKNNGYTHAVVGLGLSTDEVGRARFHLTEWHRGYKSYLWSFDKKISYPLLDLHISRKQCYGIISSAGLPVPPKSSCFFCPNRRQNAWNALRRQYPEAFQKAVELDRAIRQKRQQIGKDPMFLHPALVPLSQAVGNQLVLFDIDNMPCESGYCFL